MFKFGNESVEANCTGDIRTLIDYENYYCANTSNAKFMNFFNSMKNLKSAPDLPSMELASQCYYAMFKGCTGLTTAPELPATKLNPAYHCYRDMFNGCSKLSKVTMLATDYYVSYCLNNWLDNAGTSAQSRTLKLANQKVYDGMKKEGYLPEQWQSGQAAIEYNNQ